MESAVAGDLQMHTQWSDGSGTVLEMASEGASRGHEYISITDHSKGLKIANGLDEKRLRAQGKEIAKVNRTLKKWRAVHGAPIHRSEPLTCG